MVELWDKENNIILCSNSYLSHNHNLPSHILQSQIHYPIYHVLTHLPSFEVWMVTTYFHRRFSIWIVSWFKSIWLVGDGRLRDSSLWDGKLWDHGWWVFLSISSRSTISSQKPQICDSNLFKKCLYCSHQISQTIWSWKWDGRLWDRIWNDMVKLWDKINHRIYHLLSHLTLDFYQW